MRNLPAYVLWCCAVLGTVGCSSSRKAKTKPAEPLATTTIDSLSQQLGVAVPATANIPLVKAVLDWKGTPYKYGGTSKSGIDCSGFIGQVYPVVYQLQLPRSTAEMFKQATPVKANQQQEGDIVFFSIGTSKPSHAGIYMWNGFFAHASTSKGVMLSSLEEAYWKKYFTGFGRFVFPKALSANP